MIATRFSIPASPRANATLTEMSYPRCKHQRMNATNTATTQFIREQGLVELDSCDDWDLIIGHGPVLATAIHDGHAMRESLRRHVALDAAGRRREEDPMTGVLTSVADTRLRVRTSRFQVDLNRPRDKAVSRDSADTWGLQVWKGALPGAEVTRSLEVYDRFYATMRSLLDEMVAKWGGVLLLDIHSYNHRRDGADAAPAPVAGNPDIELGVTTLDHARWGSALQRFTKALRSQTIAGRAPDVRENIRYPTGGHFPEWVYATYGEKVCTISPEFKKIYMDEWTAQLDIDVLEQFRAGLQKGVDAVREEFLACR